MRARLSFVVALLLTVVVGGLVNAAPELYLDDLYAIVWPVTAGGDLDMANNNINNVHALTADHVTAREDFTVEAPGSIWADGIGSKSGAGITLRDNILANGMTIGGAAGVTGITGSFDALASATGTTITLAHDIVANGMAIGGASGVTGGTGAFDTITSNAGMSGLVHFNAYWDSNGYGQRGQNWISNYIAITPGAILFSIDDYTKCAGDTVTVHIGDSSHNPPTAITFTEGAPGGWVASDSNNTTATSLKNDLVNTGVLNFYADTQYVVFVVEADTFGIWLETSDSNCVSVLNSSSFAMHLAATGPNGIDFVMNAATDFSITPNLFTCEAGSEISCPTVTTANTGLHVLDTNASHDLIIAPGSDLTADRTLTVTTGDSARTLTLSGDCTCDQSVAQAASPTFATEAITGASSATGSLSFSSATTASIVTNAATQTTIRGRDATTNTTYGPLIVRTGNANGTSATTGTNDDASTLVLMGGIPSNFYTAVANSLGAVTVTMTCSIKGSWSDTSYALTSGTNFTLGINDTDEELAVTATNLATAINSTAGLNACVVATASTKYVYLQPAENTTVFTAATSVAARISITTGTEGYVRIMDQGTVAGGLSVGAGSNGVFRVNALAGITATGVNMKFVTTDKYINFADRAYITARDTGRLDISPDTTFTGRISLNASALTKGQGTDLLHNSQVLTCAGGGSATLDTTTAALPAGAWVIGVTTRITSAGLTGPTSMDVGTVGTTNLFADDVSVADNATTGNANWTANLANPNLTAAAIRLTFNGANCTAGTVRVTTHYFTVTAPSVD